MKPEIRYNVVSWCFQAVVEAANDPTTPAGDAVLRDRGIPVLPDIYASGGGFVVSLNMILFFL